MIIAPSVHHTSPAQRLLSHVCGKPALSAGGSSLQLRGRDFLRYSITERHYEKANRHQQELLGLNQQLRFRLIAQVWF